MIDLNDFMFFLPVLIFGIIMIFWSILEDGLNAFLFWLILGILFLLLYFWGLYWLNRKHKK